MENINIRLKQNDPKAFPEDLDHGLNQREKPIYEQKPDRKQVNDLWDQFDTFEQQIAALKELTQKGLKKEH